MKFKEIDLSKHPNLEANARASHRPIGRTLSAFCLRRLLVVLACLRVQGGSVISCELFDALGRQFVLDVEAPPGSVERELFIVDAPAGRRVRESLIRHREA